jgi:hypothetical protein
LADGESILDAQFQPAIHINMSLVFEFASGIRCFSEAYSTEVNKDSVMNPLCWLFGTSVLAFGVLRLIERAFLSKHTAKKYHQYGLESIDFLPFCSY